VELKAKLIPVIIGATGTISKSLYLVNIPGKHEIKKLQKQPYWSHTMENANVKAQNIF
jgi:hypothetical protein